MQVLWKDTVEAKNYPPLTGDIEVDVAIVGAGITGLTAAYHLARSGRKIAVLEAYRVGNGTTGSSTGNLYTPVSPRLFSIESKHGREIVRTVASARETAIRFVGERVGEQNIGCDFKRVPFYLFSGPDDKAAEEVRKEITAARHAGLEVSSEVPPDFPFQVMELAAIVDQAQFNPLQYVAGLAAAIEGDDCRIYEGSQVLDTQDGDPCTVRTAAGKVTARQIVKATHSPQGFYAIHAAMVPQREYAIVARLQEEAPPEGIYWYVNPSGQYSIRPYRTPAGNFLLVLGEPYQPGHQKKEHLQKIEAFMRSHFAIERVEYTWAAQNYQSADNLPYIGTSPLEKNTFIATGFAADGLVYGTIAGKLISDAICGHESEWNKIFDPKRFTPAASAKTFARETLIVSRHLLKDHLFYGEARELTAIAPGEGKTLKVGNEKVAAYRDEQGRLEIVSAVCTHMGCIVHWNGMEKSWDCPCHGSRFSVDGRVLEGPAIKNLPAAKSA